MGVINLTPDSFSDGGNYNNYNGFKNRFLELTSWAHIVDLGAESTAPFNSKISAKEEIYRFEEMLLPLLDEIEDPQIEISIDTYKVDVFFHILQKIHSKWPKTKLIFNDVSGVIDSDLVDILKTRHLDFSYVFCHNLAPTRAQTQEHMKYTSSSEGMDFLRENVRYFQEGLKRLATFEKSILIDPCFGFSKSREQNLYLLKNLKTFLLQFPTGIDCLIGISRKSFLRNESNKDLSKPINLQRVEHLQSVIIYELLREKLGRNLVFRVHEAVGIQSAIEAKKLFDI